MIRKFFYTLLSRRHFWRYASFSEVSELYISRVLRMAAFHVVGSFIAIYLYQTGYSIALIGVIWAAFYIFKAIMALPTARLIAWIGPKHAILVSNLLFIPAMVSFALLPVFGPWLIIVTFTLQGLSTVMYTTAYAVDFSKVKSVDHAGKEIAYMNIFEKVTTGLSPLIGGIIAFVAGPQATMIVAAILFAFAAAPLLATGEQVRVNQKLMFKGFPWRLFFRQSLAHFSIGFDVFASGTVWALYVAIVILGISSTGNGVYAIIGLLASVVLVVAIIASYTYGKIIDRKKGGELMRAGAIGNAVTHLIRPFVVSPVSVAGLNAANELATTAYTLPYTRALFDNADLSGARTTYLALNEMLANLGAAFGAIVLALIAHFATGEFALQSFFFLAAAMALLVLTARFPLYKK